MHKVYQRGPKGSPKDSRIMPKKTSKRHKEIFGKRLAHLAEDVREHCYLLCFRGSQGIPGNPPALRSRAIWCPLSLRLPLPLEHYLHTTSIAWISASRHLVSCHPFNHVSRNLVSCIPFNPVSFKKLCILYILSLLSILLLTVCSVVLAPTE